MTRRRRADDEDRPAGAQLGDGALDADARLLVVRLEQSVSF